MSNFDDLSVTTTVLFFEFSSTINLNALFYLLPITRIKAPKLKRKIKKIKIPQCNIPGAILSLRYDGKIRGMIRSNSNRMFNHSIAVDLATKSKCVCIKLAPKSIHMCGADSEETGLEGADHMINNILKVRDILHKLRKNPKLCDAMLAWISANTKGNDVLVRGPKEIMIGLKKRTRAILPDGYRSDNLIKKPKIIPYDIDIEIADFFLGYCNDFLYHSDLMNFLKSVVKVKKICRSDLKITKMDMFMINYNYEFGFTVDRQCLADLFDNNDGFFVTYNNAINHSVNINLPFSVSKVEDEKGEEYNKYEIIDPTDIDEYRRLMALMKDPRKKKKIPKMTWIIYESGKITYSGPNPDIMREGHDKFINLIKANVSKIRSKKKDTILTAAKKKIPKVPSKSAVVFPNMR